MIEQIKVAGDCQKREPRGLKGLAEGGKAKKTAKKEAGTPVKR